MAAPSLLPAVSNPARAHRLWPSGLIGRSSGLCDVRWIAEPGPCSLADCERCLGRLTAALFPLRRRRDALWTGRRPGPVQQQ